jgi:hypothetical protein
VATTIRCAAPEQLARFLFDRQLVRGCDIDEAASTLHVRWREPGKFYQEFHQLLLESGMEIFEVCATNSTLERAIEPTLAP